MARKLDEMVDSGSKELAVIQPEENTSTAVGKSYAFGSQVEFDAEDVQYPKLRLAQGLTAEVNDGLARPGQFVMTGFEAINKATLVPLGVAKSRRYATGRGEDYQTHCSSPDAKIGHGTPGGVCAVCPMSKPQVDPKTDKKFVPCTLSYSFVAFCIELNTLVEVEFKRTGIGTAKNLNTLIMMHGAGNFAVELSAKQQKSGGNTFYVAQVNIAKVADSVLDTARSKMPEGFVNDEYDADLAEAV